MLLAKKDAAGEIFSQLEVGGRSDLDNHRNVGVQVYCNLHRYVCLVG